MTKINISSTFAILDVKKGRAKLTRLFNDLKFELPVVICGSVYCIHGTDDGVSREFGVSVSHVSTDMKVYVVMGNDFPDAVFTTEDAAEKYCEAKKSEPRKDGFPSRIYWRVYEFTLNGKG